MNLTRPDLPRIPDEPRIADSAAARREPGAAARAGGKGGLLGRLAGESLFRNAMYLFLNLGLGAICGFAALILITRLYPADAVGLSGAAVSGTALIVQVSALGFNYSLPRFLPASGSRTALINSVLTMTLLAALAGSAVFLVLPSSARLYVLGGGVFAVTFAVFTVLAAGASQLENILVADRAAKRIIGANVVICLVKVAAPAAFVSFGAAGVYYAQNVGVAAGCLVLAVVVARRGHRFRPALSGAATRDIARFSAGSYVAGLVSGAPVQVLPIIILTRFGSTQSAYWYTAVVIGMLLYQIPMSLGQALLAEAAARPADRGALMRRATLILAGVMTPVLAAVYAGAPLGLRVFGRGYAAGATSVLRWFVIAAAISLAVFIISTVLYLDKRTLVITMINTVNAAVVLGMALTVAVGARGIAVSWTAGEVVNVALFGLFAFHSLARVRGRWELLGGG